MSDLLERDPSSATDPSEPSPARVLVIDFGAQYAQLIARRVREAKVFSEVVPHTTPVEELLARRPAAIILSGGPSSVYAEKAPLVDSRLFEAGVPVLGICYGHQVMADTLGGIVKRTDLAEFGRTQVNVVDNSTLFGGQPSEQTVWMSHRDAVVEAPPGFAVTGSTKGAAVAAFEDSERRLYGVQWHPEVAHTAFGQSVIENFLYEGAGLAPTWTMAGVVEQTIADIRRLVGKKKVICALSGGVDSAVAAALVHRAVGDQLTCVFVDHGLLREGERDQVENDYVAATGITIKVVDAKAQFLKALRKKPNPEDKRKAIGAEFIRVFERSAREIADDDEIEFLVQGTLYPDVVESGGGTGTSNIKSHHNVGGLPDDLTFKLIEPLSLLFKDEVRAVGRELGLPESMVRRHPFPGPGLAIRIVGEVTEERLSIVRAADAIVRQELVRWDLESEVWQFPVVLLADVRSVGVQGDERTYGHPIVLRPVTSDDAMTADWARLPMEAIESMSTRITNEVDGVNRVTLDVTSKPPGTIEWE